MILWIIPNRDICNRVNPLSHGTNIFLIGWISSSKIPNTFIRDARFVYSSVYCEFLFFPNYIKNAWYFLIFHSKEAILKQLETELQQERTKTDSVVADMVNIFFSVYYNIS